MSEVHQAPSRGKGGDPPAALRALRRVVEAARELRNVWVAELEGQGFPRSPSSFGRLVRDLTAWLEEIERRPMDRPGEARVLDLSNREEVRAWLADLRTQIGDAVSAGEDATRPLGQRELGRVAARSAILQAEHALEQILAAAERGMA